MIDVTLQNFQDEVLAASLQTPVLLDVWAPWCGPCKQLGPVLEQLETAYGGRFKLAKLNADEVPEIAGQLSQMVGTRSIPLCVLFVQGQPVDAFVGAVPPQQIRAFLDKHVPSEGALAAEAEVNEAEALLESGDVEAALTKLADALAQDPANDDARFDYARLLLELGLLDEAQTVLADALAREPLPLRFDALGRLLQALRFAADGSLGEDDLPRFEHPITLDKRNFQARFDKAQLLMGLGMWTEAMDELLEILMRDKKWNNELARKTYVAILELLSPAPAKTQAEGGKSAGGIELTGKAAASAAQDPQAELVNSYRRKLSMALN